jgi:hypothetical protein
MTTDTLKRKVGTRTALANYSVHTPVSLIHASIASESEAAVNWAKRKRRHDFIIFPEVVKQAPLYTPQSKVFTNNISLL